MGTFHLHPTIHRAPATSSFAPSLRHPPQPHSITLHKPIPSSSAPPFRHPPPPIPSSSAKAGDPVRECAFLPRSGHNTHITAIVQSHPRQGANAPLGSRLRGSDEGWGHSTSIQPSTMPPLRHPQYLHCVILRNPTPSSSAPYSVILRTRTPSSSPPLRHPPRRRRIQFAQLRIIFHVALNIVVKHRHHYRLVTTQPPSKSPTAAPNQCK